MIVADIPTRFSNSEKEEERKFLLPSSIFMGSEYCLTDHTLHNVELQNPSKDECYVPSLEKPIGGFWAWYTVKHLVGSL